MRTQTVYTPEFEGWLCRVLLPVAAYGALAGSACAARWHVGAGLFGTAAAELLLFLGIHSAWGAVTYHVFVRKHEHEKAKRRPAE
jgi:hypothetical protein